MEQIKRMQQLAGIFENKQILTESPAKILSNDFGGNNDSEFLKIVWKMSIEDLEKLLKDTLSDLVYIKNVSPKGKIMGLFTKRDILFIKSRIKWIKQIISSKKENPNYIPDIYN